MVKSFLKYCVLLSFILFFHCSFAQIYGNEWIVSGQRYFRIPVSKSGMYVLTYNDLVSAGVPLSSSDARKIQLFHRGKEQAIRIQGEEDTHFDQSDSLIFYGIRNNGELDSLLYDPYYSQPHKYYNLYSDTTAYFLTISGSINGKRMQEFAGDFSGSPEPYHLEEILNVFTDEYDRGVNYSIETAKSSWDYGEGWTGYLIYNGQSSEYLLNTNNYYSSGQLPKLEILFSGRNDLNHNIQVILGNDASSSPYSYIVNGFSNHTNKKFEVDVNPLAFSGGQLKVTIRILGVPPDADAVSVAYIKLKYPQLTDMSGRTEVVLNLLPSAKLVSLSGIFSVPSIPVVYDLYDRNNLKLIKGQLTGGKLQLPVNNQSGSKYLITGISSYNRVLKINETDLTPYPLNMDYLIITHRLLWAKANEYATYRQSIEGGGHKPLVVDVLKLYDLFTYGEKTPAAVRKFLSYYIDKGKPEYALILGKGLDPAHGSPGNYYRNNPQSFINGPVAQERVQDLIPAGGSPGSDWTYVIGLGGKDKYVPAIPIGRIPATNSDRLNNYLNKIKEHENSALNPNALWRKNILHLSGGANESQIITFRDYLKGFKTIAEGPFWGGRVKSFAKSSTNPTEFMNVSAEVNSGIGLITFLGHSSSTYSEIDIGFASLNVYGYNNKGRYPMILMNGCASSNIYFGYSFAEDWLLTPNKGAVIFVGHTDSGYPTEMRRYSSIFYDKMFKDTIGMQRPIGQIQRDVIEAYLKGPNNEVAIANSEQMILVGDPALRVYAPGYSQYKKDRTDYSINSTGIFIKSFDGNNVNALSDSFSIGIPISNLGITNSDSFSICIKREVGTKVINYPPVFYPPIYYEDTLYYVISSKDVSTYGPNTFEVTIDCENKVPEVDDVVNNKLSLDYFMPLSGVQCLFPREFSVVNQQPVTFIAQTTDLLQESENYLIELDTSKVFNSPFKKSITVNSGSLIKWENVKLMDNLPQNDSIVYYWRVRKAILHPGESEIWANSSFIYIKESPEGWSQSQIGQLNKNDLDHLMIDDLTGKLKFENVSTTLNIKTDGPDYDTINTEFTPEQFRQAWANINGVAQVFNGRSGAYCYQDVMYCLSVDKITGLPYFAMSNQEITYCGRNNRLFARLPDSLSIRKYLNAIKDGDYILLFNFGIVKYEEWPASLKALIKQYTGAKYLDSLKNKYGYILLAKKGESAPIFEEYSTKKVEITTNILGSFYQGVMTSTLIGPADQWGTLFRDISKDDGKKYNLKIIAYKFDGLSDTIAIEDKDSLDLSKIIDSDIYPYIKLSVNLEDSVNLVPPDFGKWQVIYSPIPEGTLNIQAAGADQYSIKNKYEGENVNLKFVFDNITNLPFKDSLKVRYIQRSLETGKADTTLVNIGKLDPFGTISFNQKVNTAGFSGRNQFQVYVNPKLQKEQYYTNNILELNYSVDKDKTNPLLDVLFDGAHIMDGDIVSPSPLINVVINDENKYLLKKDTTGVLIFLQRGNGQPEPIYFNNPDVLRWGQNGEKGTNRFSVDYNPKNLPDGMYKLIVQGTDASNNRAGSNFYEISFEVINESTISHFYPYPNPFSTSTRFVFTLTGSEIPEDLKIQIMTVTGKVVREITKAELGSIRIGHNKSEYAWNGTDEFGDKLANGVYLYRVVIKNAGDNFKRRSTAGDKAFKKDYGKLYILR
ncbi:MAG: hypothetical protein J7604_09910 [Sporocytophaga sp.]|uniref:putative type IX secretion system sortase PorU2 n=1 Tax=Sporocytophaga sp. TaxID=2231183 RepID=UPI001B0068F9|nr:C25 family cysteine peptidase [Sporocytophaga sp.]MBO9700511.1 hypothetical protein [Sporocytophaga sp.]